MLRAGKTVLVITLLTTAAMSQNASTSDQEAVQMLVQQVKDLQAKVKALEDERSAHAPEATANETTSEPGMPKEQNDHAALNELRGIQWRGFGEVNYKALDQKKPELGTFGFVPGSAGNFYTGDFDLLLTSRINDRTSVLSEIVFGEGDAQSFNVDLERLLLKYDYNDHLRMSFGRYHTGIGYYNTAFHSGKWLQTTADRPLIMEFASDGGLLPTQAIGVSVNGLIPSGKLGLSYLLEYGSGDTIRPDIDGSGRVDDENNGNGVNVGLFARPPAIPGLQLGTSFYHDKINSENFSASERVNQSIFNVHAVYSGNGVEFLNEGFLIRHTMEHTGVGFNTPAFYSQISREFGHIRPFFRFQYVNANDRGFYEDISLRYGPSFGARYDFNKNIAFKLQLDHTARKGQPDLNGLQTQLAFTF